MDSCLVTKATAELAERAEKISLRFLRSPRLLFAVVCAGFSHLGEAVSLMKVRWRGLDAMRH